jgi:hypothetical protein
MALCDKFPPIVVLKGLQWPLFGTSKIQNDKDQSYGGKVHS